MADARDLKSRARNWACRFESGLGYVIKESPAMVCVVPLRGFFRFAGWQNRATLHKHSIADQTAAFFGSRSGTYRASADWSSCRAILMYRCVVE